MEFDAEKFEIEEVNDWVILRKYHGNDEKLVIPEGVTDIYFEAFGESLIDKGFCTKEIVLPESLTTMQPLPDSETLKKSIFHLISTALE